MGAEAVVYRKHYSFDEYLKLEEQEETRYEYYDGEVFAMAGGTLNHNDIAGNIYIALKGFFGKRGCRAFMGDVKMQLRSGNSYVYPDVALTCQAEDLATEQFVKSPMLIVEVLSPSTESYDRNVKWNAYRRLTSLRHFMLINEQRLFVELYSRNEPNELYTYQVFDNIEEIINFPGVEFSVSMEQIYENVRLPKVADHYTSK